MHSLPKSNDRLSPLRDATKRLFDISFDPSNLPKITSTQVLHEKGRLLNLAIFVVNLHAQLVRQYLGSLTFFFFSRLFALTFVVLLISLPYPIPVRFFNWLYLFSTSFNRLSFHIRGACVCTFFLKRVHASLSLLRSCGIRKKWGHQSTLDSFSTLAGMLSSLPVLENFESSWLG